MDVCPANMSNETQQGHLPCWLVIGNLDTVAEMIFGPGETNSGDRDNSNAEDLDQGE